MSVLEGLEDEVARLATARNAEVIAAILEEGAFVSGSVCAYGRALARMNKIRKMHDKMESRKESLKKDLEVWTAQGMHTWKYFQGRYEDQTHRTCDGFLTLHQIKQRIAEYNGKLIEYAAEMDHLRLEMLRRDQCGDCPMCGSWKHNYNNGWRPGKRFFATRGIRTRGIRTPTTESEGFPEKDLQSDEKNVKVRPVVLDPDTFAPKCEMPYVFIATDGEEPPT